MPRPLALADLAIEVQVDLADIERTAAPMWPAAKRTRRDLLIARCRRLARLLRASRLEAREIAGLAETRDAERIAA